MIPGVSKAWPRITLAVFLPTPASRVSSSIVAGTFAAEFFHQLPRAFFQRFGLGAKEAQTPNDPLDVRCGRLGKARRVGIATEKFRRDSVYRLIRALGRENDCDQQLKGVSVLERNL